MVLPNGTSWTFSYDSAYGTLSKITFPTGGTISYQWATATTCTGQEAYSTFPTYSFVVTSRTVNANDGSGPHTWSYNNTGDSFANFPSSYQTIVTDPLLNNSAHTMTTLGTACLNIYETELDQYSGSHSTGTLLEKTTTAYSYSSDPYNLSGASGYNYSSGYSGAIMSLLPTSTTVTDVASGKAYESAKSYDSGIPLYPLQGTAVYGNVTGEQVYDCGNSSGSPGSLIRSATTKYQALNGPNASSYLALTMLSLPYSVQVNDGSGNQASLTQYNYDETSLTSSGLTSAQNFDTAPPSGTYRGNNTSVLRWLNSGTLTCPNGNSGGSGSNLISKSTYFNAGTIKVSSDPCGDTTTYAYSPTYVDSVPTTVTNALGQQSAYGYDFNSGLKVSETDPNQRTTGYGYDSSWRLTSITYPDNGSRTYCYSDSSSAVCGGAAVAPSVLFTETMSASQSEQLEADVDGLGRTIKERVLSDPDGVVMTDTTYDGMGRVQSVSNPYRTTSDPTYGITSYLYDALNRKLDQCQPDNSSSPSTTCVPQNSYQSWSYSGNVVTFRNEDANQWLETTDALGRLTWVVEPGALVTNYAYDALNDLQTVNQVGNAGIGDTPRARSFSYDSLSRLLCASNPENSTSSCPSAAPSSYVAGSVGYTYDPIGNVSSKIDARPVTTNYSYDALNRLLNKTYIYAPAGSLSSCYQYDTAPNGIGRLTAEWTQAGSCQQTFPSSGYQTLRVFGGYDTMGRVLTEQQCVAGYCTSASVPSQPTPNCPSLSSAVGLQYCYDLSGNLLLTSMRLA